MTIYLPQVEQFDSEQEFYDELQKFRIKMEGKIKIGGQYQQNLEAMEEAKKKKKKLTIMMTMMEQHSE